jgi:hypothetical protein
MAESEGRAAPAVPEHLLDLFRSVLAAGDEELRRINAWAGANVRTIASGDFDSRAVAEEIGVSSSEVMSAAQLLTSVLYSKPIGSPDVELYASALGGGDLSAKARLLLDGVQIEASEAARIRRRLVASQSVLPTVQSLDVLCDLRGVFQESPSPSASKSHGDTVGKLLGFEPIVVVGLQLNDGAGNDTSYVFQMTERSLRYMLKTLEEGLVQLEAVRKHHVNSVPRS